jgi:O-acetyl-ADP-ribose deacetylase (regulator of RNase III)
MKWGEHHGNAERYVSKAEVQAMLIYYRTSLLESSAQTVVNTVNCVGVMGKGIAHAFRLRYPEMFPVYKKLCDDHLLQPGSLWLWRGGDQWVLNFPTKIHWRNPSRIEWVEAGLKKFVTEYAKRGITEIAFPRLGCGNGGLNWDDVRPLMEKYLTNLPIPIYIHDYERAIGLPEHLEARLSVVDGVRTAGSFSDFVQLLRLVIERTGGTFTEPLSHNRYRAVIDDRSYLSLIQADDKYDIDADHLRGLWTRLKRGLLTHGAVQSTVGDRTDQIMHLLSFLPEVRPVEVQKVRAPEPEIALELERSARIGLQSRQPVDA